MARVLCAGHVNWDVTLRVDGLPAPDGEADVLEEVQSGGGSAANVAHALAGLGHDVALLASVGDDRNGRLALDELTDAGVDCSHVARVANGRTAVKYLVVGTDGEVMVFGRDGANEAFEPSDLPRGFLRGVDHVHLTAQRPGTAAALAARAGDAEASVSFDPGRRLTERDYRGTFDRADVLLLNEREADTALDHDPALPDEVVRKRGAGGAELRTPEATVTHPGFDVRVVDTAGAGDAFAAGFLAARLDGERDRALAVGNACGAIAARRLGARTTVSRSAVDDLLEARGE